MWDEKFSPVELFLLGVHCVNFTPLRLQWLISNHRNSSHSCVSFGVEIPYQRITDSSWTLSHWGKFYENSHLAQEQSNYFEITFLHKKKITGKICTHNSRNFYLGNSTEEPEMFLPRSFPTVWCGWKIEIWKRVCILQENHACVPYGLSSFFLEKIIKFTKLWMVEKKIHFAQF